MGELFIGGGLSFGFGGKKITFACKAIFHETQYLIRCWRADSFFFENVVNKYRFLWGAISSSIALELLTMFYWTGEQEKRRNIDIVDFNLDLESEFFVPLGSQML
jgi:hypothetical protein